MQKLTVKLYDFFGLSKRLLVRLSTSGLFKRVVLEDDFKVSEANAASIFRFKFIRVKARRSFIHRVTRNMRTHNRVHERKKNTEERDSCIVRNS
jgi:hypothetical protein